MREKATAETVNNAITNALDEAKELQRTIGGGEGGRELALTITNLEQAQLWLTKVPAQ